MLPKDPMILLSYVNTKLRDRYPDLAALCRDEYDSLDQLCEDLDADRAALEKALEDIGFSYDPEQNRFR